MYADDQSRISKIKKQFIKFTSFGKILLCQVCFQNISPSKFQWQQPKVLAHKLR